MTQLPNVPNNRISSKHHQTINLKVVFLELSTTIKLNHQQSLI